MGRRLTEQQFRRLHERFMPPLYRAALYLLGDTPCAETVAGQAWLETAASGVYDEREFGAEAAQRLIQSCEIVSRAVSCRLDETVSAKNVCGAALLGNLCGLSYGSRRLLVLSGVLGLTVPEIARILEFPAWLVQFRLARLTEKIHANSQPMAVPAEQRC